MTKIEKCILGLVTIQFLIILSFPIFNKNYNNLDYINFKNRIDSLTLEVNNLKHTKDSLLKITEKRLETIDSIEYEYENANSIIYTMPIDSQFMFFSGYLSKTNGRYFNKNYSY